MQPHSMCALGTANFLWKPYSPPPVNKLNMTIRYVDKFGDGKINKYEVSNITLLNPNEFNCYISRKGQGLKPCKVTVRRLELKVVMTHSEKHGDGTWEEFKMGKKEVTEGQIHRSQWYKGFKGKIISEKQVILSCTILKKIADRKTLTETTVQYELRID